MEAPQLSGRRQPLTVAACGCMVVVAIALGILLGPRTVYLWSLLRPRTVNLVELQVLTGLRFPPTAELAYSRYERMPRGWLKAKLYLRAEEVQGFIDGPPAAAAWTHDNPWESTLRACEMWEPVPEKSEVLTLSFPAPRVVLDPQAQKIYVVDVTLAHPPSGRAVVYIIGSGD